MTDYVKIKVPNSLRSKLEQNPLLDFCYTLNSATGEIRDTNRFGNKIMPSKNAFYKGLEFKIYDNGTITISGSLHKYWNEGGHNYNDFDVNSVVWVLNDLKIKFGVDPKFSILRCLEIGLNIVPPIPTNDILDNCFLHKTKPFEFQKNSDEGKYKQVQHSQYIIKIYNKALHYQSKGFEIDHEIMRFEIKYTKMQKLNERGIFNMQDLINYGLQNFKNDLLTEWKNVLFFDPTIQIDPLRVKTKNVLLQYSNPNYWIGLLVNDQIKNYRYHKNQLRKITFNNSKSVQESIGGLFSEKIDFLYVNPIQIDPLIILSKELVSYSENKYLAKSCRVTGINIGMQKKSSVLLSHTGLKYYYDTDKKIFEQIKRRYLTKIWLNSSFEIQIKEIAHNIRNAYTNRKNRSKNLYQPQQMNLFYQSNSGEILGFNC